MPQSLPGVQNSSVLNRTEWVRSLQKLTRMVRVFMFCKCLNDKGLSLINQVNF